MLTQLQHFCRVGCGCPLRLADHTQNEQGKGMPSGRCRLGRRVRLRGPHPQIQRRLLSLWRVKEISAYGESGKYQPMASEGKAQLGSLSKWSPGKNTHKNKTTAKVGAKLRRRRGSQHLRDTLHLHHHLQGQQLRQGRRRRPACSPKRRIAGGGGQRHSNE